MYWFRSQHALDDIIACSKTRTRNNLGLSFCKCQKLNFVLIHDNFLLLTPDSYEGNEGQVVQKTALKMTPWFSKTKSITHSHLPLDPEGTKLIPGLGCLFWVWCLVFNSWFSSVIFSQIGPWCQLSQVLMTCWFQWFWLLLSAALDTD